MIGLRRGLSFRNISGVYVWFAIIVVFSLWAPDTFPTMDTARQILNANAVTGLVALSVVVPLSARVFDLSIAYSVSLCGVLVASLVAHGWSIPVAVLIGLLLALGIGLVNAIVVVVLRVDSFIGTLATGSLFQAVISMVTNDQSITGVRLSGSFAKLAGATVVGGLTVSVLYLLILAVAIWFLLEYTATGRRLYATGFNADAARLSGIKTDRLRFAALITSALLSGLAGIVLASTIQSGDPSSGTPYLLSAFAAAFLGATQFKAGRFNAWGTVLAVILIATGTTGLGLVAAPNWAASMFTGVVLIVALAVTSVQRRAIRGARSRFLRIARGSAGRDRSVLDMAKGGVGG